MSDKPLPGGGDEGGEAGKSENAPPDMASVTSGQQEQAKKQVTLSASLRSGGESKESKKDPQKSPDGKWVRTNKRLGHGSFKSVYLAIERGGGEVAWNVIKLGKMGPNQKKKVRQEVEILKDTEHKHIINFFDYWETTNRLYFITERASATLTDRIAALHPVAISTIRVWAEQILHALVYLHSRANPIIHRDLKPDNVFVASDGTIRLGDFGLAIQTQKNSSISGTPAFMAPEIWTAEAYDAKVDVYAFGMLCLEMKTNKTPYIEHKGLFHDRVHGNKKIPPPKALDEENFNDQPKPMNKLLREMITSCLSWEPTERPSAKALLEFKFFHPKLFRITDCKVTIQDENKKEQVHVNLETSLQTGGETEFDIDLSKERIRDIAKEYANAFQEDILKEYPDSLEQDIADMVHQCIKRSVKEAQRKLTGEDTFIGRLSPLSRGQASFWSGQPSGGSQRLAPDQGASQGQSQGQSQRQPSYQIQGQPQGQTQGQYNSGHRQTETVGGHVNPPNIGHMPKAPSSGQLQGHDSGSGVPNEGNPHATPTDGRDKSIDLNHARVGRMGSMSPTRDVEKDMGLSRSFTIQGEMHPRTRTLSSAGVATGAHYNSRTVPKILFSKAISEPYGRVQLDYSEGVLKRSIGDLGDFGIEGINVEGETGLSDVLVRVTLTENGNARLIECKFDFTKDSCTKVATMILQQFKNESDVGKFPRHVELLAQRMNKEMKENREMFNKQKDLDQKMGLEEMLTKVGITEDETVDNFIAQGITTQDIADGTVTEEDLKEIIPKLGPRKRLIKMAKMEQERSERFGNEGWATPTPLVTPATGAQNQTARLNSTKSVSMSQGRTNPTHRRNTTVPHRTQSVSIPQLQGIGGENRIKTSIPVSTPPPRLNHVNMVTNPLAGASGGVHHKQASSMGVTLPTDSKQNIRQVRSAPEPINVKPIDADQPRSDGEAAPDQKESLERANTTP